MRSLRQQRCSGHDLSALAVSALRNIFCDPSLLQWMQSVCAQAFDRRDAFAPSLRNRHSARTSQRAIDMNAASAAQPGATAEFRAGQLQRVAQDPQQRSFGGDIYNFLRTVYTQCEIWHGEAEKYPRRKGQK